MSEEFQNLIARARDGDKSAFAALYNEYSTPLYRFVYGRVNDKTDADDIVQDAFIRAFAAIGDNRFGDQGKGMLPYLMTISRNLVINRAKKKKADVVDDELLNLNAAPEKSDTLALAGDDRAVVGNALDALTEIEREVITLRFYAERTYGEIAEILEKREDAIRQHVARALRKMRAHLNNDPAATNLYEI